MGEDLTANLENYKSQLQQVETALSASPDNEDLLKLKKDLQEVIDLTVDLIKGQEASAEASSQAADSPSKGASVSHKWNVDDRCLALYLEDDQHYPATVTEVDSNNHAITVTYDGYNDEVGILQAHQLKPLDESRKRGAAAEGEDASKPKTKRDQLAAQRDYKRKKQQKKQQRQKQLEEDKEEEKNKWLNFNSKVFSKTTKGKVKKSIFASPDSNQGRVGIGTCGQAGKPMTAYHQNEKWKKGMM